MEEERDQRPEEAGKHQLEDPGKRGPDGCEKHGADDPGKYGRGADRKGNAFLRGIRILSTLLPILIILGCIGSCIKSGREETAVSALRTREEGEAGEVVIRQKSRENHLVTEQVISTEIIEDSLQDMGFLVTENYYFKEMQTDSKDIRLLGIALPFTEESYIVSYEGTVTAGIDFTQIRVTKDDGEKLITIRLPDSEIQGVMIDQDSFELLDQKTSAFNKLSIEDYHQAQLELERKAREGAEKRGILERASTNAENLIRSFVSQLIDTGDYRILVTADPAGERSYDEKR